jgi:phospholipase C
LQIHDEVSAETFDMWGLLDARISSVPQDEGVTTDIAAGVAYNLYQRNMFFGPGNAFHVSNLGDLKVSEIKVSIGPSAGIQPSIPALMLDVGVQGQATIRVGGAPLATVGIRDNRVRLEVGVYLDEHGSLRARTWIDDAPIDLDVHWTTDVETALVSFGILTAVANEFVEGLEVVLNEAVQQHFRDVVEDAMNKAPQVLAVLMGDDFTYRDVQMHGDDLEFSYVAPLEPDPKPSAGYVGIIGRSAMQTGPTVWEMTPPTLGDTWSAQNLAKIDHIVVVMMENRSFDHVLGYRARRRDAAGSDGLTNALTDFLSGNGFAIRPLKDSDIPENSVHRKTGFPRGVGHSLDDVAKQLQFRLQAPSGRSVNSPQGFIDDFTGKANGLQPQDVLGYYEADDLPFFAFLAENYAYCEQYFCSHAGPTMPNRMFSLSGDVQYDRTGEAILDNNEGDYLYLSRGLTIFDLLTRKGVGWRVYESFPSITMLRWFARYAGDVTNIVSLGDDTGSVARLLRDVAGPPQDFPPVVFIDPAFHHHPQNDDHPEDAGQRPAVDMWRGQQLLKDVYDALVSNRELWSKTLLIITYDEHGGFYDHVIAPLAEALFQPSTPVARGDMGTIASSMTIRYGLRVPTFVVSPWTPAGKGPDMVLDHCSILKTITARFLAKRRHGTSTNPRGADLSGGHGTVYYTAPFLSDRVQASRSLDAYLSCTEPRLDVPASPTLESLARERPPYDRAIITEVLSRAQMRRGDVDFHALTGWLARQFGR